MSDDKPAPAKTYPDGTPVPDPRPGGHDPRIRIPAGTITGIDQDGSLHVELRRPAPEHPAPWRWEDGHDDSYEVGALFDGNNESIMDGCDIPGLINLPSRYARELLRAAPEMEALLRRLEVYEYDDDGRDTFVCPVCDANARDADRSNRAWHFDGCALAALLARIDAAKGG